MFGYQCEIDPSDRAWTGGLYDEQRRDWLYQGNLNPPGQKAYKFGEWNRVRIEAIGTSLRTFINDVPVGYVIDDVDAEGFIALQVHSIGKPEEAGRKVMFRNIRIQTTDLKPSPTRSDVRPQHAGQQPQRRREVAGLAAAVRRQRPRRAGAGRARRRSPNAAGR